MQLRISLRKLFLCCLVGFEIEAMDRQSDGLKWLGRYSGIAVVLSVVTCYGTVAVVAVLSLVGVSMSVHEGAWATLIVALAWIAVLAMGINIQRHRSFGPFIIADVGALLLSWVMFVDYSRPKEIIGFALLIVAALWDRKLRKQGPVPLPDSEQGTE